MTMRTMTIDSGEILVNCDGDRGSGLVWSGLVWLHFNFIFLLLCTEKGKEREREREICFVEGTFLML